jgi:hypothetical protein
MKNIFKKTFKGEKVYGVSSNPGCGVICNDLSIERAKDSLDSNFKYLVEMTVTRVFTSELKEIETEY